MADNDRIVYSVPATEIEPEPPPRCPTCDTALWWMGSVGGWDHSRKIEEVDPVALAMRLQNPEGRRWLPMGEAEMYGGPTTAEAWALEGTPPRGFVLAVGDAAEGFTFAVRLDGGGHLVAFLPRQMVPAADCPSRGNLAEELRRLAAAETTPHRGSA